MGIYFGAMADPLRKQLEMTGIDAGTINHLQRDADAVTRLVIRGLIGDSQANQTRKRIMKKIDGILKAKNA